MIVTFPVIYTLYAHNLTNPSKSFSKDLMLSDFTRHVDRNIIDSIKIVYKNPRGEEFVLVERGFRTVPNIMGRKRKFK